MKKKRKNGFTVEGLKKALASPKTPEQLKPSLRARLAKMSGKNPGELVILGLGGNPKRKRPRKRNASTKRLARLSVATCRGCGEGHVLRSGLCRQCRASLARKKSSSRKRNASPLSRAREMFSKFHGRESSGVFEMQRSAKARKDYTILGPLVAIGTNAEKFDQIIRAGEDWDVEQWDKLPHLAFLAQADVNKVMRVLEEPNKYLKNVALLATSPNGKQLYVISEEPLEIDVSHFDTDTSKDFVDLGEATFVNYVARKPADPKEWIHTFGEEGGTRPRLVYDRLNKIPMFIGGSYRIEAPGIIN